MRLCSRTVVSACALALLGSACSSWNGEMRTVYWWGTDQGKLVEKPFAQAVYLEPAKIVDHDAGQDFTVAIPTLARSYQQVLADFCSKKQLFSACTTVPTAGSMSISTEIVISNYRVGSLGWELTCGLLLPPLLGMAWAYPVFSGNLAGEITWTLKDDKGAQIHGWNLKFDDDADVDESLVFLHTDGFPKFLETATQAMIARYGRPDAPPVQLAAANPVVVQSEPAAPKPRKRSNRVVAVFDVQDASGKLQPDLLEQLTEYLAAQLVEISGYRVVPRSQLRGRLVAEKQETSKTCYDEGCQIELGKALAAEKSLQTKLLRVGASCAITATLYDLKTETTEAASSVEGDCSENGLMGNIKKLAEKLTPDN